MQKQVSTSPPLWISDTDEHGNQVNREVIDAAHRIWTRVLQHLRQQGHEVASAAEILESACHRVSRAIRRGRQHNHIRSIDSYLFWAFVRRYSRRMLRENRIEYVESVEAYSARKVDLDHTSATALEDEIQFKELLSYLDPRTRQMVMRRIAGDSWAEIGERLGIAAHNAEVQFANGIKKARSRLLRQRSRSLERGER
jgi:RNA polymerase sigma factor (sigma-70 family)